MHSSTASSSPAGAAQDAGETGTVRVPRPVGSHLLIGNQAGNDLRVGSVGMHPEGWRRGRGVQDSTQALGAAQQVLHPAQHPRDPPVAGHDDAADDPPALVAVGVGVVAQEGLADPPAVAVGAAALGTAVASLIPQGVELQPVL